MPRMIVNDKENRNVQLDGAGDVLLQAGINAKYNLDGNRKVSRSTVHCAVKNRLLGKRPPKEGTPLKVLPPLLNAVAAHVVYNQVEDGNFRGG